MEDTKIHEEEKKKQTYYSIIYQYGHVVNNTLYYRPIGVVKGTVDHESGIFTTDKGRNFKALDLGISESEEERVERVERVDTTDLTDEEIELLKSGLYFAFPISEDALVTEYKEMFEDFKGTDEEFQGLKFDAVMEYFRKVSSYVLLSTYNSYLQEHVFMYLDEETLKLYRMVDIGSDFSTASGALEREEKVYSKPLMELTLNDLESIQTGDYGYPMSPDTGGFNLGSLMQSGALKQVGTNAYQVNTSQLGENATVEEVMRMLTGEQAKASTEALAAAREEYDKKVDFDAEELIADIQTKIIGQDPVVEAFINLLYSNNRYRDYPTKKKDMLIIGPTGCGKTSIPSLVCKELGIPYTVANLAELSDTGLAGKSIGEIIESFVINAGGPEKASLGGVIILNEIDKILNKGTGKGSIADELLDLIEGRYYTYKPNYYKEAVDIDLSNITFVATGAFSEIVESKLKLPKTVGFAPVDDKQEEKKKQIEAGFVEITDEDLRKAGLKTELIGRFKVIKVVRQLGYDDFVRIAQSPISNLSVSREAYEKIDHVTLVVDPSAYHRIAARAVEESTGARGVASITENMLNKAETKFRLLRGQPGTLLVTDETVDDDRCFSLYRNNDDGSQEVVYEQKVKRLGSKLN